MIKIIPVRLVVSRIEKAKISTVFCRNTHSTVAYFPLITLGRLRREWVTQVVNSTVIKQGVITGHRVWLTLVEPIAEALGRTILLSQSCFILALVLLNRDGTMSWYQVILWLQQTMCVKGPSIQHTYSMQAPNKLLAHNCVGSCCGLDMLWVCPLQRVPCWKLSIEW